MSDSIAVDNLVYVSSILAGLLSPNQGGRFYTSWVHYRGTRANSNKEKIAVHMLSCLKARCC